MSSNRLERYLPGNKRVRMLVLMLVDIGMICLASFFGLFIRFDMNIGKIPAEYARAVLAYLPVYVVATIAVFFLLRMYATMWSVAGLQETGRIVGGWGVGSLLPIAGMVVLGMKGSRSYFVVFFLAFSEKVM